MQIADMITRMTRMMALIGIAVGLLGLPLAMFGGGNLRPSGLALIFARRRGLLRTLSRTRSSRRTAAAADR